MMMNCHYILLALLKAAREEKKEEKTEEINAVIPATVAAAAVPTNDPESIVQTSITVSPPPPPLSSSLPLLLPATVCTVPTVTYSGTSNLLPELSAITAAFLSKTDKTKLVVKFIVSTGRTDHLPCFSQPLTDENVNGDCAIARYLVRESSGSLLLGTTGSLGESLVDQWLDYYTACLAGNRELSDISCMINTVLATKTYLVGDQLTLADISVFVLLQKNKFTPVSAGSATIFPHTNRWWSLVSSNLGCVGTLPVLKAEKKYPPKGAGKAGGKVVNNEKKGEAVKDTVGAVDGTNYYLLSLYCYSIFERIVSVISSLSRYFPPSLSFLPSLSFPPSHSSFLPPSLSLYLSFPSLLALSSGLSQPPSKPHNSAFQYFNPSFHSSSHYLFLTLFLSPSLFLSVLIFFSIRSAYFPTYQSLLPLLFTFFFLLYFSQPKRPWVDLVLLWKEQWREWFALASHPNLPAISI